MKIIKTEILIVGAGQAGLLAAYYLTTQSKKVLLVDANKKVGDSWKTRYDCLRLLTPWTENYLPGLALDYDPKLYPSKDEYASYLEKYSKKYKLTIRQRTTIKKLTYTPNYFFAYTDTLCFRAEKVIVATGPFQKPFIPALAKNLSPKIITLHTSEYKNDRSISKDEVLIVGGGYSGMQIASELASQKKVTLAMSKKIFFSNNYDLLYKFAYMFLSEKAIRRVVKLLKIRKIQTPQLEELFVSDRINVKPRVIDIKKNTVFFSDGSSHIYDAVIWATGYRFDFSWISIPGVFDKKGSVKQKKGIGEKKGLYVIYPEEDYGFIRDLPKKVLPIVEDIMKTK